MKPLRRRSLLYALAGVGVAGLAGCSGDDGETGSSDGSGSGTGSNSDNETGETNSTVTEQTPTPLEPVDPSYWTKFTPASAEAYDFFGWSLAVSGSRAVVSAYRDEYPAKTAPGSAYVYERTEAGWVEQAELDGGETGEEFGGAVAVDADTALVGAPAAVDLNGVGPGSVYVYQAGDSSWRHAARLTAAERETNDAFGCAVSIDGDTALVGARGESSYYGTGSGAAYVFGREGSSWVQRAKLKAPRGDRADNFGQSVGLVGDTAVVGAHRSSFPNGSDAGTAFVYQRSGGEWTQTATLAAADGDNGDRFGWTLDVSGDRIVIGAPGDEDPNGSSAGAAYVFGRRDGGWRQVAKLSAGDGDDGDRFGHAVGITSNVVVVGAPRDEDPNGDDAGSAYVFQDVEGSWVQQGKIAGPYSNRFDRFGSAVGITREVVLTGTPYHERPAGRFTGAVQVFGL